MLAPITTACPPLKPPVPRASGRLPPLDELLMTGFRSIHPLIIDGSAQLLRRRPVRARQIGTLPSETG